MPFAAAPTKTPRRPTSIAARAYLTSVLAKFPNEYSSALVTDAQGVTRCASLPTAVGINFSDREIFRLVRDTKAFAMGAQVASRVAPRTVIPAALPLLQDGAFRGMCAIEISLTTVGDLVTPCETAEPVTVALVDRNGGSIGGDPLATRALPVSARLAAAIVGEPDGVPRLRPGRLVPRIPPVAACQQRPSSSSRRPIVRGSRSALVDIWGGFGAVVLALAGALLAVWLGADRWCVRPLRYIRDFADRVARGEDIELARQRAWGPELASVGEGVKAMAEAIASREAELRAGLEQRDHMLREIHHRVKNNLQMISSLLNLQAGEIRSPRIRRFFGDAQNRVLTLSILHRHLYERSSWALVDFQQFISDLVRQISVGRRGPDLPQPRYHIRAPIMAVGPDIAIPIGLIVTEAVSSALDRSFDGVTSARDPHRGGRQGRHGRTGHRGQRGGTGWHDQARRPQRLWPDADPRAGDAARRRGRSIVARRRRHEGQRDLPQARGAGGRCVACVSPRARPASSSD